jgi:hypothetical protein
MYEDNALGALGTVKGLSLTLAVMHHGLSCLADGSIPAKIGTVLQTATVFEQHMTEDLD